MTESNFDYQTLDTDINIPDLLASTAATLVSEKAASDGLWGITSETDGGIIAYAIGLDHATAIVRALNAAEGEYEAELVATIANGNGAGDA